MDEKIQVPNSIPKYSNQSSWVLKEEADTITFGKYLANLLIEKNILLLDGPLGSGKTSLVKGIAQGLLIKEAITSPTFALSHQYFDGKRVLIHLDLYRLEEPSAANELFIQEEETANISKGLMIIECPSRLSIEIEDALKIKLEYLEDGGRKVTIKNL